jgi:tetraacyldisaccharide 4'-kinase
MKYFRILLYPFSILYGTGVRLRNFVYDTGLLKIHTFRIPIILTGNLTTGGTGKTPHVEYLVRLLSSNYKVAVLSRGYGRKSKGFVEAKEGTDASEIGDEPMQYFSKFKNITVAVCENRKEGIRQLMQINPPVDVILMDDGFQHRRIKAGINILLTRCGKLFISDHLLPAGNLREPRSSVNRAQCIIVTKCPEWQDEKTQEQIKEVLKPREGQYLFFSSALYKDPVHFFRNETLPLTELNKRKVILFTGIADSEDLVEFIRTKTLQPEILTYTDHYNYSTQDLHGLREKVSKATDDNAILLTTEKDYYRLKHSQYLQELNNLAIYYLPMEVRIGPKETFEKRITEYVEQNKRNR